MTDPTTPTGKRINDGGVMTFPVTARLEDITAIEREAVTAERKRLLNWLLDQKVSTAYATDDVKASDPAAWNGTIGALLTALLADPEEEMR